MSTNSFSLLLSGPGAGKGTQCAKLVEEFQFVHLSAGDLLRAEMKSGSEQAALIDNIIKEGKIVPVAITCGLIKKAMQDQGWATKKYLVDGFPRNQDNYEGWNEVMGDSIDLAGVLHFVVEEETLIERIMQRSASSGRTDDNVETLRKRLKQYNEQNLPIVEIYTKQGKVHEINGLQEIDAVYADVKKALANYL